MKTIAVCQRTKREVSPLSATFFSAFIAVGFSNARIHINEFADVPQAFHKRGLARFLFRPRHTGVTIEPEGLQVIDTKDLWQPDL